jgi:hypothetical protein
MLLLLLLECVRMTEPSGYRSDGDVTTTDKLVIKRLATFN